jgi:hypothetical protein
MYLLCFAK